LGNGLPRVFSFGKNQSQRPFQVVICSLFAIVIFSLWTTEIPHRIEILTWLALPSVAQLLLEPLQPMEAQRW
jgi:hypothetical protein